MTTLAARYRGRIASWEIWNEPDNRDYWLGSPAEYAALLAAGARAVHAADPTAQVVMGGIAGHPEFAAEVLSRPEVSPLVDVVNAHAYFETWNGSPTEALRRYVAAFASSLAGGRRPLWMAEVGYSTYRNAAVVSPDYRARFGYEHTVDFQAVELVRTVALAISEPAVKLLAWYRIKDPPAGAPMIGDDNNRHLGVTFADGRPKPALGALALMNRLFGAGFVRLHDGVHIDRSAAHHAEAHAFLALDRVVIIAWIPTVVAAEPGPATAGGDAKDERRERLAIELPFAATGPPQVLDAEGRLVATGARLAGGPSSSRLEDIDLLGGSVTIVELPVHAPLAPASRGL